MNLETNFLLRESSYKKLQRKQMYFHMLVMIVLSTLESQKIMKEQRSNWCFI